MRMFMTRSLLIFFNHDRCVCLDGLLLDPLSRRMEDHLDVDALAGSQSEVALGRGGRVVAVKALASPDRNLLLLEELALGRHPDSSACGRPVSLVADRTHANPMLLRQVVAKERDALLLPVGPLGTDDKIEHAVAVDVAEAKALVDRRPRAVGNPPGVV